MVGGGDVAVVEVDVVVDGTLVVDVGTVDFEPEAEDSPLEPHADATTPNAPTTTMLPNQRAPMRAPS